MQAVKAVYPEAQVTVVGRTLERAQAFASSGHIHAAVTVPDDADVIITTTTSKTPVYDELPRAGRLVVGVGAFTPDAAEIGPQTLQGSQLFVDDPAGARHEAGDFIQAGVDWASVRSLADALTTPPGTAIPAVFKSVGCAAWDLAACRVAREHLARG